MMRMDWRLALITLAVLPLIAIATNIFRNKVRESVPANPHGHRSHQCPLAGACQRHDRVTALQS